MAVTINNVVDDPVNPGIIAYSYEVQIINFRDFVRGIIFRQHLVRIANSILPTAHALLEFARHTKNRNISKCVYSIYCNFLFDLVICSAYFLLKNYYREKRTFYRRYCIGESFRKNLGNFPETFLVNFSGPPGKVPGNTEKNFWKLSRVCSIRSNWIPLTHIASLYKHTVPFNHIDTLFT